MKRKVTDLKQNEAILISNDSERDAILQLMDRAGWVWNDNSEPFEYIPTNAYPYFLCYKALEYNGICIVLPHYEEKNELTIYPAIDFIGSEGDFDIPSNDSTISTFLRWQIDWYESNHDYQIATDTLRCWLDELEGKTEPIEQPRNTPTNEHPNQP
jgi:hypothetical protein